MRIKGDVMGLEMIVNWALVLILHKKILSAG